MRTKYQLKEEAISLRKEGVSLIKIEKALGVKRGTLHYWCKDIVLNDEQIAKLKQNSTDAGAYGRALATKKNREDRQQRQEYYNAIGKRLIDGELTDRELLLVGTALYWSEGSKARRWVQFGNSDPFMIKLYVRWLKCLGVKLDRLRARLWMHNNLDEREQKEYWKKVTGLLENQFYKTGIVNRPEPTERVKQILHGVLHVYVTKSTNLFYRIEGMIKQLC